VAGLALLWLPIEATASSMVATLPPLAAMVQALLPDARPGCLLNGGADPHHLQISPRKAGQLRSVHLLVRSSGDDGGWSGLRSLRGAVVDLWPQEHHPWLVPGDLAQAFPRLLQALVAQHEVGVDDGERRMVLLARRLQQWDRSWEELLRPLRQRGVVMQHPAWQRLFVHYHIPVRAVLERSHHGNGSSPRRLENTLALLRGSNPPLLVAEMSHSNRMIDWLRKRVPDAQVVSLDALGQCGQPLSRLIEANQQRLRRVLAP